MSEAWTQAPIEGPRERIEKLGSGGLSDAELLALLLGTGARGRSATSVALAVLEGARGLHGLERSGPSILAGIAGVGPVKAARVAAALELGRRACARPLDKRTPLRSSRDVAAAMGPRLRASAKEHIVVIPLDSKNRPLSELRLAVGSLSACPVTPAEVFRAVLAHPATGLIFVHNHPSGDPQPSPEDLAFTERLLEAGELLGIRMLDHVILGRGEHFSFLDAGLLHAAGAAP